MIARFSQTLFFNRYLACARFLLHPYHVFSFFGEGFAVRHRNNLLNCPETANSLSQPVYAAVFSAQILRGLIQQQHAQAVPRARLHNQLPQPQAVSKRQQRAFST